MNYLGIICDVKATRASVKLENELTTDYLNVVQYSSNANSTSFKPIKIGEQVLVIAVNDDINSGVILRGIYQDKHKLKPSETKEYVEFSDGTCISYDTANSSLEINVNKTINISCIDCNLKANSVKVDSPNIDLGLGGTGVITCQSICHFTGAPHGDGSSVTRSAK